MQLKNLVEKTTSGLKINSAHLVFELQNFTAQGGSYAARSGSTDDCIMALCVVMKLLNRVASYDDGARKVVYETVAPDSDATDDPWGDEPAPMSFL